MDLNQRCLSSASLDFVAQLIFELVFIGTGKVLIMVLSLGQWRCESIFGKEGQIHGAAGALSFVRDGQRVITTTGMMMVGFLFYIALVTLLVLGVSRA